MATLNLGTQKTLRPRLLGGGLTLKQAIVAEQPGVKVVEVPIMTSTDNINNGAVDYDKFGFLTDPVNLIIGFQRMVKIEKWRDPREGATSFVPSVRVDCVIGEPAATVLIHDIPTTLT